MDDSTLINEVQGIARAYDIPAEKLIEALHTCAEYIDQTWCDEIGDVLFYPNREPVMPRDIKRYFVQENTYEEDLIYEQ